MSSQKRETKQGRGDGERLARREGDNFVFDCWGEKKKGLKLHWGDMSESKASAP